MLTVGEQGAAAGGDEALADEGDEDMEDAEAALQGASPSQASPPTY